MPKVAKPLTALEVKRLETPGLHPGKRAGRTPNTLGSGTVRCISTPPEDRPTRCRRRLVGARARGARTNLACEDRDGVTGTRANRADPGLGRQAARAARAGGSEPGSLAWVPRHATTGAKQGGEAQTPCGAPSVRSKQLHEFSSQAGRICGARARVRHSHCGKVR